MRSSLLVHVVMLIIVNTICAHDAENDLRVLYQEIGTFYQAGDFDNAIESAQNALEVAKEHYGLQSPAVYTNMNTLANLFFKLGLFAEVEPLLIQSLELSESIHGENHPEVAKSLHNLAVLYRTQGRYAEVEDLLLRSLEILEIAFGPEHFQVAICLNSLAVFYCTQERFSDAETHLKRSLKIFEAVYGPDHLKTAMPLSVMAKIYHYNGQYLKAEPLFIKCLEIREKALGSEHSDVAEIIKDLAGLYHAQGRYFEAEELYLRSLRIFETTYGMRHPKIASNMNSMAILYKDLGRYDEAELLLIRSLEISEEAYGPNHPKVAAILGNLAELYFDQGRYFDADPLYESSLKIEEAALDPDHTSVALSLNNQACLFIALGRYSDAESHLKRSLNIFTAAFDPSHPDVAMSLNSLASLYSLLGRFAEAEAHFKRSLNSYEVLLGAEHPTVAIVLANLADTKFRLGFLAEAESLYMRSLDIRKQAFGLVHPDVGICMNNIGLFYRESGRYDESELYFTQSLNIIENTLGVHHPKIAVSTGNIAALHWEQERPKKAAHFYRRTLTNISLQFRNFFPYMSEQERLLFLKTVSSNYNAFISFCISHSDQTPAFKGELFDTILRYKSMILSDTIDERLALINAADTTCLRTFEDLTVKRGQLYRLVFGVNNSTEILEFLNTLQEEIDNLESELSQITRMQVDSPSQSVVRWLDVRDRLAPNEAVVEYVHYRYSEEWEGDHNLAVVVLLPNSEQPELIELGKVSSYTQSLVGYDLMIAAKAIVLANGEHTVLMPNEADLNPIYEFLWAPLDSLFSGIKRIYVSPDGVLNQINLGLMCDETGRYLMDRYELHYVNSMRQLVSEEREYASNKALLIGNPRYDLSGDEYENALASITLDLERGSVFNPLADEMTGSGLSSGWNSLPSTEIEVSDLSDLLQSSGWETSLYLGREALEETVKSVSNCRVLHLATHGFFLPDKQETPDLFGNRERRPVIITRDEPLLRSGLVFAGADHLGSQQDRDDGIFTAYEARQLDLHETELVVLSACETGMGEIHAGEGVFGLRRAFAQAGAGAVMMSLWSVPDLETREMMYTFYEGWLSGLSKYEAFQQAQQQQRDIVFERYGVDLPRYWGGFILVGN